MEGVDAGFLYMETPTLHMHTLKVAVLDFSGIPEGLPLDVMDEELGARLHLLPPLRKRVLTVPLHFHHPMWVEGEPDIKQHIHHHRLPGPGEMAQAEALIGEIASTPLPRDRPLWEIHVIEGLANGHIVIAAKIHHAVADGTAANAMLAAVMDTAPGMSDPPPAKPHEDRVPGRLALLRIALVAWFVQIATIPALLAKTARGVRDATRRAKVAKVRTPRPILDAPRTSFNGALTPRRSFATLSLPLQDFKDVRVAADVSFNDVVLGVVGGALRMWLDRRGEEVSGSLLAGVPVSTEGPGGLERLGGNRVSNLFTTLATDIDDPWERLRHIAAVTDEAKAMQKALGLDLLERWTQFTPPGPFTAFMRGYSKVRGANLHRPPFNAVVSNVPGPREHLTMGGVPLADIFSVGPIIEGIGLNITVWSYVDRMNFSALACPDLLPDLRGLVDLLPAALAELKAAAKSHGAAVTRGTPDPSPSL
ncbi:MAG TPA: wax ester/triacylglycerol synthase family O-acyltransferase [Mycobacteriales bacterium]|nr:wax ester/triacylglycerol synthase family O-acyltransferase [Mycobacteriales bacterium]